MTKQKGAASETVDSHGATYASGDDGDSPLTRSTVSTIDMLDYMADMLMELRGIADQNKWKTLSGLLALSHAEANARRDSITMRGPPA